MEYIYFLLLYGVTGGDPWSTFFSVILVIRHSKWLSGNNIPFTVTMVPLLETLSDKSPEIMAGFGHMSINPLWWAVLLWVKRGNLTLIGSSAGVVAAGISAKYGFRLTFREWFKIGLPFTILDSYHWHGMHYLSLNYCYFSFAQKTTPKNKTTQSATNDSKYKDSPK